MFSHFFKVSSHRIGSGSTGYLSHSNASMRYCSGSSGRFQTWQNESNPNWDNVHREDIGFNFGSEQGSGYSRVFGNGHFGEGLGGSYDGVLRGSYGGVPGGGDGGVLLGCYGGVSGGGHNEGSRRIYGRGFEEVYVEGSRVGHGDNSADAFAGNIGGCFVDGIDSAGSFVWNDGLFSGNEKQIMQNLNDRLAAFLGKVHALEDANTDLEDKIKEWYWKNSPGSSSDNTDDYSKYLQTIEDLQTQIFTATMDNDSVILQIDNILLAANDFRLKYENEIPLRQSTEADIKALHMVLEELTLANSDFMSQIESMTEELTSLKNNHEKEIQSNQSFTVGQINVEMDAAPDKDLTKLLNDMRGEYEVIAENNRKHAEDWYIQMSGDLKQEISVGVQQVQMSKTEIIELKQTLQSLEMELQSQFAIKRSLEDILAQTEGNYCMQISQIQIIISSLEEQLAEKKIDANYQKSEYELLLTIKTHLEKEIETYRRLLEEGDFNTGKSINQRSGSGVGSRISISSTQATRSASNTSQTSIPNSTTQTSRSSTIQSSRSESTLTQSSRPGGFDSGGTEYGHRSVTRSLISKDASSGVFDSSGNAGSLSGTTTSGSATSDVQSSAKSVSSISTSQGLDSSISGREVSGSHSYGTLGSFGFADAISGGQSFATSSAHAPRRAGTSGQSSGTSGSGSPGTQTSAGSGSENTNDPIKIRKTKKITEAFLDSKVIATQIEEFEELINEGMERKLNTH